MSSETAWTSLYIPSQVSTGVLCSNLVSASREGHPATGSHTKKSNPVCCTRLQSLLLVQSYVNDLKWAPLKDHWHDIRITFLFKIATGRVAVQAERTLLPADSLTRHKHKHKYRHLQATCNHCLNSFFVNTIPNWNSLPEACTTVDTVTAFQSCLHCPHSAALQYPPIGAILLRGLPITEPEPEPGASLVNYMANVISYFLNENQGSSLCSWFAVCWLWHHIPIVTSLAVPSSCIVTKTQMGRTATQDVNASFPCFFTVIVHGRIETDLLYVCAGVVGTVIWHSTRCTGQCSGAIAGTTRAVPDSSTNNSRTDYISWSIPIISTLT